jgi:hypothetical protein
MKYKVLRILAVAITLVSLSVLGGPSIGQAGPITITDVVVHVGPAGPGGNNFCGTATCSGVSGTNLAAIWSFPVVLNTGDTLLLAQHNTAFSTGFNFDTSDFCIGPGSCVPLATITVFTDQGNFSFTENLGRNLSFPGGVDTLTNPPLETREFASAIGASSFISLLVGYADSAHLQATHPVCAAGPPGGSDDGSGGNAVDCLPDTSPGASAFTATIIQADKAGALTTECLGSIIPCFDSGVLLIRALPVTVPEPSTLLLLGSGLLGLAAWGRRRLRS